MRNVLGNNLTVTVFGESHGSHIGAVIDGITAGIKVDENYINDCLAKRRPQGKGETARVEKDNYSIVSGVFNGYTTGSPLCIIIENNNTRSKDYSLIKDLARPSHADYVANVKYNGFNDYRGGGHFSGRITASIVASGAILLQTLEKLNIKIGCHIKKCGNVIDKDFNDFNNEIDKVNSMIFPVIDDVEEKMKQEINNAASNQDSIGGIIQTAITGLPVGLGEPMFSSLEGELSKALFAIGGIKGIEFGLGFNFANVKGSEANDEFSMVDGKVKTITNNNGGINGGISNSMPVVFNVVVRPTPSILKEQNTINMQTKQNEKLIIHGRHDPAIIRRINIVIRCMCAFVISDMLITKYGQDIFLKESL
ncbi:MAG: chorismate synthase [Bacilli bacterium]|nr:chorismate synthase [Bacilli bacterium]